MSRKDSIGQRLQYIRNNKGLTLEQLAKKAEISKSFLWEVEHDNSGISGEKLLRVANALGASLDYLLKGESDPQGYKPEAIEIPWELSEIAEENGLSYRQTLSLLEIDNSIIARRSTKPHTRKTKEEWNKLYDGVKDFLEEE